MTKKLGARLNILSHSNLSCFLLLPLFLLTFSTTVQAQDTVEYSSELHRYSITAPSPLSIGEQTPYLGHYTSKAGQTFSISRIDASNLHAWWRQHREAFFEQIEKGLKNHTPRYRQNYRHTDRVDGTPHMDICFTSNTEWTCMRFLFHRRFAIVASVTGPKKSRSKHKKFGRAFVRSLVPHIPPGPTAQP